MEVHAEDLEPLCHPGHLLDQHPVAVVGCDDLVLPVGEGVGARAEQGQVALVGLGPHLGQGAGEIGLRLADGVADAGDDLDRALEQLVLRLGVLAARMARADRLEDRRGVAGQLAGVAVDELELDLDPQAGANGAVEVDVQRTRDYSGGAASKRPGPAGDAPRRSGGGGVRPTWAHAAGVTTRPWGVRMSRPCWMRKGS